MKKTASLSIFLAIAVIFCAAAVSAEEITVCTSGCNYTQISSAAANAQAGDVVNVLNGTYTDVINIHTQITLNCTSDVLIQPDSTPEAGYYDVFVNASNTVISNCIFDLNGADDTRGGQPIVISDMNLPAVTGVQILNNIIYTGDGSGVGGTGVVTGKYSDISGLVIDSNIFHCDESGMGEGVYINPHNNSGAVTITNNQFYGNVFSGVSIEASGAVAANNFVYSNATTGMYGIRVFDATGGETYTNNAITNNTVLSVQYGVRIGTSSNIGSTSGAAINSNNITNTTYGIWARYGAVITTENNSIAGNTYGLYNSGASQVSAEKNWWGSSTGPGGAGSGSGDPVTANVDYEPFCSNAECTAVAITNKPEGFAGAGSTNFSSVSNYSSVSLALDNGVSAVVNFSSPVDLSSSSLNFNAYVSMATGYISIDSADMPELNAPATVKFTGLSFSQTPVIYRDGSVCPSSICSNINYNNITGVLTFTVTGFSTYYVSNGLSIGVSRLNYWEKENHTISMGWTGGGSANLTALIPSGWEFVSGSGCTNSSLVVTCNNVANNSEVSFVISVVNASVHPEFEIASIQINATSGASSFFSPDLRIIRMQDHNIFHTLVEYGRGRGNYFFDSYDSGAAGSGHTGLGCSYVPANTLLELNFLHKVVNIKQKFKIATSTAESATFTCTYPDKNVVRLHLAGEMIDLGDLVRVDYAISEIEGSWERMGYLGIDFAATDYGANENITINCTNITYSLPGAYGNVIVDEDAFTLEFRNKTPFAVSASGKGMIGNGSQEMEITYNITNLEQYTVSDVIAEIKAPQYATFIGVRGELWGTSLEKYRLERLEFAPGETEQVTLVARFNTSGAPDNMTTLQLSGGVSIEYVTCWEVNSYNPARYLQYLNADGNGTVNMSMSTEIINLIERILRIESMVTIINSTVYEMNSTLVEFYYYMNNTVWENLTAVDLLDRLQNFTDNTGDIITEITYLREFNDELAFLVTDSFNAQKDARSFLANGDVGSAAKSLTDARDKLQQAAVLLEKEQNTLNNRMNGSSGNKWVWIIPLLAVAALLGFYFFGKREIKEEDAAAEKAPKASLKRPQKGRRN